MTSSPDHSAPEFAVNQRRAGSTLVVAAEGEVDITTAPALRAALQGGGDSPVVVLDLRKVAFLDTSGLQVIIEQINRAREEGWRFAVTPGPGAVRRILEVAGLSEGDLLVEDPEQLGGVDGHPA